jgi:hypothetical protein
MTLHNNQTERGYQLAVDYNLKCHRLFIEDGGIYWKDLGPIVGTDESQERDVRERLANYALAYGLGDVTWVKK